MNETAGTHHEVIILAPAPEATPTTSNRLETREVFTMVEQKTYFLLKLDTGNGRLERDPVESTATIPVHWCNEQNHESLKLAERL